MDTPDNTLPVATVRPVPRWSFLWLLPLLALAGAAALVYFSWYERGIELTIDFAEGHGLKLGDTLRYRGIEVGRVREIGLTDDLRGIRVTLGLQHNAASLAKADSRFWIVRPQVALSGASGLDTVIGANYLQVLPGDGERQTHFVGLELPPFAEMLETGGLTVRLTTPSQGGLRPGAPVTYRQFNVGTITAVDLAKDASVVNVEAYIKPAYLSLIRDNTRFWKSGGAKFDFGWLSGPSLHLESMESLVIGGITLAVPPTPGEQVATGHKFRLYDEPAPAWREWTTYLALDSQTDHLRPVPQWAKLQWQGKGYLDSWLPKRREGWVLPVVGGLLGPAALLQLPDGTQADSITLTLADEVVSYSGELDTLTPDLVILKAAHRHESWALNMQRKLTTPEDAILVGASTRFLAADDYYENDGNWLVSQAITLEPSWYGACVVSAQDGALLGILVMDGAQARLLRLPGNSFDNTI